jgi:hypothetical protein
MIFRNETFRDGVGFLYDILVQFQGLVYARNIVNVDTWFCNLHISCSLKIVNVLNDVIAACYSSCYTKAINYFKIQLFGRYAEICQTPSAARGPWSLLCSSMSVPTTIANFWPPNLFITAANVKTYSTF